MNVPRTVLAWLAALLGAALAIPAVLALLPFWAVAAGTLAFARLARRGAVDWSDLFEFDPRVGWRSKPHMDCRVGENAFHATTDRDGWRFDAMRLADADVVVFGDSYAFGFGVDDARLYGGKAGPLRVKPVGAAGYSMVQPVLWMERLSEALRGKLVLWWIYLGNDLDGNLSPSMSRYRAPFVREEAASSGGWEIVTDHLSETPWPFPSRRTNYENFVEICTDGLLTRRAFGAGEYLIRRGRDICAESDARLVVATIPDLSPVVMRQFATWVRRRGYEDRFDPGLPDRRLGEICHRLGVEFLPLAEHLDERDYFVTDGHWNPRGHRKVGALIASLYRTPRRAETPCRSRLAAAATGAPAVAR